MLNRIRNAWWAFRQGPNISMADLDRLIEIGDLGEKSSAGVRVSERSGSRLAEAYTCINILSRDMSALPLRLLEKTSSGGSAEVITHPVAVWAKTPNPAQTPMEFRQLGWAAVLSSGNQYAQVMRGDDDSIETWPVSPQRITKVFLGPDKRKRFEYRKPDGTAGTFGADELFHSYGLSFGGWTGVSPIRWCAETFGRAIALGEYAAAAFQSPRPSAIFEHPTGFADKVQAEAFKEQWKKDFAGKRGRKNIAVLPAGMVLKTFGEIPNDDAQFIETAKLSKEQILAIFLVPMHRGNALDKATFSNIEHQDIEYVKYSLLPWLTTYEQSLEKMLLTSQERERFQIRHNVEGLLRGDFKTRMEGYALGIDRGVYLVNEARAKEDRPPIEGGDQALVPLNMGLLSKAGEDPADEPAPDPDEDDGGARSMRLNLRAGVKPPQYRAAAARRRLAINYRAKVERALQSIVSADAKAVRAKLAENLTLTAFLVWVEQYFGDRESATRQAIEGIYASLATDSATMAAAEIETEAPSARVTGLAGAYSKKLAEVWRRKSTGQLQNVANEAGAEDYIDAVDERIGEWLDGGAGASRARKEARRETVSLTNAIAALVFASAGFGLVWVTFGKNCPYCDELAGKRVKGGEQFVGDGEFNPAGADRPIKIRGGLNHPPAHSGCDCSVAPG